MIKLFDLKMLLDLSAEEETQSEIKQNEENITEEFVKSVKNAVRSVIWLTLHAFCNVSCLLLCLMPFVMFDAFLA